MGKVRDQFGGIPWGKRIARSVSFGFTRSRYFRRRIRKKNDCETIIANYIYNLSESLLLFQIIYNYFNYYYIKLLLLYWIVAEYNHRK